jgi:hypothetical protein
MNIDKKLNKFSNTQKKEDDINIENFIELTFA